MPIYWDRLNWQEYRDLVPKKIDTVILPVGTIEAHGVTNLATDVVIPLKIAEEIADLWIAGENGEIRARIQADLPAQRIDEPQLHGWGPHDDKP